MISAKHEALRLFLAITALILVMMLTQQPMDESSSAADHPTLTENQIAKPNQSQSISRAKKTKFSSQLTTAKIGRFGHR